MSHIILNIAIFESKNKERSKFTQRKKSSIFSCFHSFTRSVCAKLAFWEWAFAMAYYCMQL